MVIQAMLSWLQHVVNIVQLKTLPPILRSTHLFSCTKYARLWQTNGHARRYSFQAWMESACPRPQQIGQIPCKAEIWWENMLAGILPKRNWQGVSFWSRNKQRWSNWNTYWSSCHHINLKFLLRQCLCPQSTPWWKKKIFIFSRLKTSCTTKMDWNLWHFC